MIKNVVNAKCILFFSCRNKELSSRRDDKLLKELQKSNEDKKREYNELKLRYDRLKEVLVNAKKPKRTKPIKEEFRITYFTNSAMNLLSADKKKCVFLS